MNIAQSTQMRIELKLMTGHDRPQILIRGEVLAGGYTQEELNSCLMEMEIRTNLSERLRCHIQLTESPKPEKRFWDSITGKTEEP